MRALAAGFLVLFCGCAQWRSHPAGSPVVQSLGDGEVDRIAVMGGFDVTVTVGEEAEVVLHGTDDDLDAVDVRVRDGRLEIGGRRGGWGRPVEVEVEVTMPRLREAAVAGSGDLVVQGVRGEEFVASVSGSGALRAKGEADDIRLSITGSGDLDLSELTAKTAHVVIAGSGNARLHASDRVVGSVSGSGDVGVAGGAQCQVRVAGSGGVDC
jgi:hypothetical protein